MIVCLTNSRQMFSLTLPEKIKGQYWMNDTDENGRFREVISVEESGSQWALRSNRRVQVLDANGVAVPSAPLTPGSFYNLQICGSTERLTFFTEGDWEGNQRFTKYVVNQPMAVSIGRNADNQICYPNTYVSGQHAILRYDGKIWSVEDLNSTNGTYVNGNRVTRRNLVAGDFVYIMGLKMIIGLQFVAINRPDENLAVQTDEFYSYRAQPVEESTNADPFANTSHQHRFFRSPRFFREIEEEEITIDPPPTPDKDKGVPLAYLIGPSATMSLASVSTATVSIYTVVAMDGQMIHAIPSMVMAVSMLLGTVLWPVLTKRHEKKKKIQVEKERHKKYLAYLDEMRDVIRRTNKNQADILRENLVPLTDCADRITGERTDLWERSTHHSDFLSLRVGLGNLPLMAKINYDKKKFALEDDDLMDAMLSLGTEPQILQNVPIHVSLKEFKFVGVTGDYRKAMNLIKAMVLQMMALHSYTEVKVMLLTDNFEKGDWQFAKWVPHFWNDDKTMRYIATNRDEAKELSHCMDKAILSRMEEEERKEQVEYLPHYVIISTGKELQKRCEAVQKLLANNENLGYSILMYGEKLHDLPKETELVISLEDNQSSIFDKDDTSGKHQLFVPDTFNEALMNTLSEKIANIELGDESKNFKLPNMITFLEMFQVGKIEHLNALTRWKENNPTITLQTPIGVSTNGDPFMLDLHENYHGPHGLVAGMTGSGKSEFIITYILSLAVNYHPDEVAFILIDYKGGGLTGAFEDPERGIKLPHLAGTITNLDGTAIKRALTSIQSELRRRQAIFNEARRISNEGTMDIYKYQKLYRDHVVTEPVPHLFIISDEFAELKAQQPDFMQQLISTARIGRSLGVHLILATQKPNGVVDDQIWSNSKFRICLKVQDRADSQEMIKCPDAAELVQTGRFYLQVGFNELFALGQSAWCGAPYKPVDSAEASKDESIEVVDTMGRPLLKISPEKTDVVEEKRFKQVVEIVNYLSALADEEHITERPLWLPPIPDHIYADDLIEKYHYSEMPYHLAPLVGEYDDPFNQKQFPLVMDISGDGNCLIYGSAGNGKTTFLTTMCYAMIRNHTAEEFNLYILDFGSETLNAFAQAPQVGDVLFSGDEEKLHNLFKMLCKEIEKRKSLFAEYGGDYHSYIAKAPEKVPNIVVMINNYSGFFESYESYQDTLIQLTRDGVKYGIYFVVAVNAVNEIRYKVSQNFKTVLTMQLNDATDYPMVVGKTEGLLPSKCKGRGLMNLGKVYEIQIAYCKQTDDYLEFLRNHCMELSKEAGVRAKRIPILPDVVNADYFATEAVDLGHIPVAVAKNSLETININLEKRVAYPIVAEDINRCSSFVNELMKLLDRLPAKLVLADSEKLVDETKNCQCITGNYEDFIADLFAEMVSRNNAYKSAGMSESALSEFDERVYVIVGLKRLYDSLSADGKEKLRLLIEKDEAIYKITFIIVENYRNMHDYGMDAWYKRHLDGQEGIWIGDGITEQYMYRINKLTSDLYEETDHDYGYIVRNNKPQLVKLLTTGKGDE